MCSWISYLSWVKICPLVIRSASRSTRYSNYLYINQGFFNVVLIKIQLFNSISITNSSNDWNSFNLLRIRLLMVRVQSGTETKETVEDGTWKCCQFGVQSDLRRWGITVIWGSDTSGCYNIGLSQNWSWMSESLFFSVLRLILNTCTHSVMDNTACL